MCHRRLFCKNWVLVMLLKGAPLILFLFFGMGVNAEECNQSSILKQAFSGATQFDFFQTKKVAALSRPLKSQGGIWVIDDQRLIWQVQKPIKSTLVISKGKLKRFSHKDIVQPDIDSPIAANISRLMFGLFTGQLNGLQSAFEQKFSCADNRWYLRLVPTTKMFSKIFAGITLTGGKQLDNILIEERNGDTTAIQLVEMTVAEEVDFEVYLEN